MTDTPPASPAEPCRFRKKPVVIEAMQYTPGGQSLVEAWMIGHGARDKFSVSHDNVQIHTLEGVMAASPGDWIIRGVKGEFYPCKPDIFAATYEPATPPASPAEPVYTIAHDGFTGTLQGRYVTREGKRGVVLQQVGTRIVHVYGEKWLATPPASPAVPEDVAGMVERLRVWPIRLVDVIAAADLLARVAKERDEWNAMHTRECEMRERYRQRAEAAEEVLRDVLEVASRNEAGEAIDRARAHLAKHGGNNG